MLLDVAKVKLAMARKQMTFRELMKASTMSNVTGLRILSGREIQPKTAGRLAAALGVDVAELLKD